MSAPQIGPWVVEVYQVEGPDDHNPDGYLAIPLPQEALKAAGLDEEDSVLVSFSDGRMIIEKVPAR